jgi:hypothetical protein
MSCDGGHGMCGHFVSAGRESTRGVNRGIVIVRTFLLVRAARSDRVTRPPSPVVDDGSDLDAAVVRLYLRQQCDELLDLLKIVSFY